MRNKNTKSIEVIISTLTLLAVVILGSYFYQLNKETVSNIDLHGSVIIENISNYGSLSFFKDKDNLYIQNMNSFENQYFGMGAYHVDLQSHTVNKIDALFLLKEKGKIVGARPYRVGTKEIYENGSLIGYALNQERLAEVSREVGINQANLVSATDEVFTVLIKSEYDPVTKAFVSMNEQIRLPAIERGVGGFMLNGKPYPGNEFTNIGYSGEDFSTEKMGIQFDYNFAAETLTITY